MKKLSSSIVAFALFCSCSNIFAQEQVVILKTKPVPLVKQGDVWIAPADETVTYYGYTDNGVDYVCTVVEPTELVGTKYTALNITRGTTPTDVRCYGSSYFIAP